MKEIWPTFLIPGAAKSGTSYISNVLSRHPDIYMAYTKEPSYFSVYEDYGKYRFGPKLYHKSFVGYDGEAQVGEASTVYMYDPKSPELIRGQVPDCKLVFSLRDPVDRFYSNYWQSKKGGISLPDFDQFIQSAGSVYQHMLESSRYDTHLERYARFFPDSQILVIVYEQLRTAPRSAFLAITEFLDVDPLPDDLDYKRKINTSALPRSPWLAKLLRNRRLMVALKSITPSQFAPKLKGALETARRSNEKQFYYPPMSIDTKERLIESLAPVYTFAEGKLNIDMALWRNARTA